MNSLDQVYVILAIRNFMYELTLEIFLIGEALTINIL
jgi:hypothetical protein